MVELTGIAGGGATQLPPHGNQAGRALWRRLRGEPKVIISGAVIALVVFCAAFAPWIAPVDPLEQDLLLEKIPPVWLERSEAGYLLGTDSLGRDVFSRMIHACRITVAVAFIAATLACLLGTVLGLAAGYFGGWVDSVISRLVDMWMSFPPVLLSILLVAVMGSGLHSVILAIVIIDWTRFCRVVRSETVQQAKQEYVDAAVILGMRRISILIQEILPNVLPMILVLLTLEMGIAVTVEAILSFVSLSISTDTPTWGGMIAEGRQVIYHAWWLLVFPLAALFLTVLAFNQLGDGLRSVFDPVLRR